MESNEPFSVVDLQAVADFLLSSRSGKIPEFVRDAEKEIADALCSYTEDITGQVGLDSIGTIEDRASLIFDAISRSNCMYLENGMRLGAQLAFELLGCIR